MTETRVFQEIRYHTGLAALFAVATAVVLMTMVIVAALIPGWSSVFITSDSMAPNIRQGDIVIGGPYETIQPGQVVVFDDPAGEGLVTHRVVRVLEDGGYVTSGDANRRNDSTPVPDANIVATGRYLVPMLGWPMVWVANRDFVPLAIFGLVALMVVWSTRFGLLNQYLPAREPLLVATPAYTVSRGF